MAKVWLSVPVAVLVVGSYAAWAVQTGMSVVMDGRSISTDVQILNGHPFVALDDVAQAWDMSVVKSGTTYRLVRAGGANQLTGVTGKLATTILSGAWSLKVISVQQVASYAPRYGPDKDPVSLQQVGDVLFIVTCRLKNGMKETQDVYFARDSAGNTSLTDDQSHGYSPVAYDTRNSDYSTTKMLPGSAHDFALVFSVPRDTRIKDLIYTANASGLEAGTDFRVSLQP